MRKITRPWCCLLFVFKVFARRQNQVLALCTVIGLILSTVSFTLKDKWMDVALTDLGKKAAPVTQVALVKGEDAQVGKSTVPMNARLYEPSVEILNTTRSAPATVDEMVQRLLDLRDMIRRGKFEIVNETGKTHNATFFSLRDLAEVQLNRSRTAREVCDRLRAQGNGPSSDPPGAKPYHTGWWKKTTLYGAVEAYVPQHFLFCPALKVASTFWKRLLYALQFGSSVSSPYQITINRAVAAKRRHLTDVAASAKTRRAAGGTKGGDGAPLTEDSAVAQFYMQSAKVMFARQPFSKLLSGYVDKLFSPNPYFWNAVGRYIVRTFRSQPSAKSLRCGHDVTFPEFVQYVIEAERTGGVKRDAHFAPVFDQCKPCDLPYDIIGKMETFKQDIGLVVAEMGFNLSRSTLDFWQRLSEQDAIADSITSPYLWQTKVSKCITWEEATRRIWRRLQIRGIIDKAEAFPKGSYVSFKHRGPQFIELAGKAWERFRASNASKSEQKMEAMVSAYSLVPRDHLEQLREYFLLDFELFGYPSRPDSVFAARRTWDVFNIKSDDGKK